jgi:hypothetical protein
MKSGGPACVKHLVSRAVLGIAILLSGLSFESGSSLKSLLVLANSCSGIAPFCYLPDILRHNIVYYRTRFSLRCN